MQGGGLDGIAKYWPALNRTLETNKGLALENQQRQDSINLARSKQSALAQGMGGYDPASGLTLPNLAMTGSQPMQPMDLPASDFNPAKAMTQRQGMAVEGTNPTVAAMRGDPMLAMAAQVDPQGTLSSIVTRMMAPPKSYQITGPDGQSRTGMFSETQIRQLQGQGLQIAEVDKAKPIDPNQAPTLLQQPGADNREHSFMWQPGMGAPKPWGAPGKIVNPAQSELGKMAQDMQTMGGGASMGPGFSGSPTQTQPPAATQPTFSSGGLVGQPGMQPPAAGQDAYGRDPARRPWLQPPVSSPAGVGSGAPGTMPTMADIMRNKMVEMATPATERARQIKEAENSVPSYGYEEKQDQVRKTNKAKAKAQIEGLEALANQVRTVLSNPAHGDVTGKIQSSAAYPNTWFSDDKATAWSDINNLRSKAQIEGMARIRAASPTGGAGGNVTEAEWPKFESLLGNLDPSQGDADYNKKLADLLAHTQKTMNELRDAYNVDYAEPYSKDVRGLLDKYAPER